MLLPSFFPLRKIRRNGGYLLFGAVLLVAAFAAYLEFVATSAWSSDVHDSRQKDQTAYIKPADLKDASEVDKEDEEDKSQVSKHIAQPWRLEYKGQANLHVFEDWCGSSIADLRKNLHFPLYPHSRSTVKKLAVSPRWTNYGLRIFGYIHPYTDGTFVFAVASDDNCEFWLSQDENPDNLKLSAFVGKTGKEWTAPGEYGKYASQISQPVLLHQQNRYYFELIHKQNDRGTDHVEVAWRLHQARTKFEVIDSQAISLYTDDSSLKMNYVSYIPQTAASHVAVSQDGSLSSPHGADMLREDPRDTFYQIPLLDQSQLRGVLPECAYKPSYIIKGFPLLRYQGLQFVRLLYVYPNDYTRLTHMENDNKCFYQEKPYYLERYGFSMYMKLDLPGNKDTGSKYRDDEKVDWRLRQLWNDYEGMEQEGEEGNVKDEEKAEGVPGYGDDYDDYSQQKQRKLLSSFSTTLTEKSRKRRRRDDRKMNRVQRPQQENSPVNTTVQINSPNWPSGQHQRRPVEKQQQGTEALQNQTSTTGKSDHQFQTSVQTGQVRRSGVLHRVERSPKRKRRDDLQPQGQLEIRPAAGRPVDFTAALVKAKDENAEVFGQSDDYEQFKKDAAIEEEGQHLARLNNKQGVVYAGDELKAEINVADAKLAVLDEIKVKEAISEEITAVPAGSNTQASLLDDPRHRSAGQENDRAAEFNAVNHKVADSDSENVAILYVGEGNDAVSVISNSKQLHAKQMANSITGQKEADVVGPPTKEKNNSWRRDEEVEEEEDKSVPKETQRLSIGEGEGDTADNWVLYGDSESDDVVLNKIGFDPEVNWAQTFRVKPLDFQTLRSDWIDLNCNVSGNLLFRQSEAEAVVQAFMEKLNKKYPSRFSLQRIVNVEKRPDVARGSRYLLELDLLEWSRHRIRLAHYIYVLQNPSQSRARGAYKQRNDPQLLLCNPHNFQWNPKATVHFIVPVKNQARWVQQFIVDMEELYRATGDTNFNIIIADYDSTDMDVEQALKNSHLPSYQYLRLLGNFQRSAGLQAGIDLITDTHSILFLCDLHIHFPLGFIDSVRRHCVEGRMAFAPIVMRLNCGATPQEPDGYWEVNGFGLLGIYKSDLDTIGGMNTKDFTYRWGGEDWELLDRILQAGLEVERLYVRNFFHYHHSRRGMWNRKIVQDK